MEDFCEKLVRASEQGNKPMLLGQSSSDNKYPVQPMASIKFSDQQSQTQRPPFSILAAS